MASLGFELDPREAKREGRRLLLELVRRERWPISVALGAAILGAAFEGLGLGLLIPLLKSVADPAAEPIRIGVGWIDTWVLAADKPPLYRLYQVSGLILLSIVLRTSLAFAARTASITAIERGLHYLRVAVFDRLLGTALPFYTGTRGGVLVNAFTTEINRIRLLLQASTSFVTRGFVLLAYVAFIVAVSWQLMLIVGLFMALMVWGLKPIVEQARSRGRMIARENGALASVVSEFIGGVRTVFAFNGEDYERRQFHTASRRVRSTAIRMNIKAATVRPLGEAIASVVLIGIVVVSTQVLVLSGELSVAAFLAFLFALFRLFPIIHELNNQRGVMAVGTGSWEHMAALLSPKGKPAVVEGDREPAPLRDGIRFEGVTFAYGDDEPVLRSVDLEIRRGDTVALVGASGAGKSTLVDLIPRFYDPTHGRILYDGVDLRDFRLGPLRDKMAVVSQDTFLFHDTVTANIAYGLDDMPEDRVRWAAEQANALAFIEDLPEGFDTVLGDRGVRLSGGQRQRIAIARALLRDPEILILDEATSALDSMAEQQVQQSLERLMEGRTAIVIAHRLSTVESADLVVVLEAGRVVEEGPYEALVAQQGKLWEFHVLQNQIA
ncbi:MAG: ABC transporter ATP-binding protein [Rubricoccaceae bacterium]|nr:ABC transporter ATP-binding protein [Rubricoccaceae bacterium]